MDKNVEARFERIERALERFIGETREGMAEIRTAHLELEAAQKNTAILLNRFIEETRKRGEEVDERITKLTIQVDRLVAKDLEQDSQL